MNSLDLIELTRVLVSNLVSDKENIKINLIEEDHVKVIQVLVKEEDMGKVIGAHGNIANLIRTIIQASAYQNQLGQVRVNIDTL